MAPNKKRNAGRQLLNLKRRMNALEDQSKMPILRRREASLLMELGQGADAVAIAASLTGEDTDGSSMAFLADLYGRLGRWRNAEEWFGKAFSACMDAGREEKARAIASGPLFLLAEARGDHARCLEVAPFDVLRARASRLGGTPWGDYPEPLVSPWREIHLLESVHRGADPSLLSGVLDRWSCGEAEWRWRVLFEGAVLFPQGMRPVREWKKYLSETGKVVLDPRYPRERKELKRILC